MSANLPPGGTVLVGRHESFLDTVASDRDRDGRVYPRMHTGRRAAEMAPVCRVDIDNIYY